jgi:hypothetical protein
VVEGEDLAALPGVLERLEEATHVVVALAGEERAFGA